MLIYVIKYLKTKLSKNTSTEILFGNKTFFKKEQNKGIKNIYFFGVKILTQTKNDKYKIYRLFGKYRIWRKRINDNSEQKILDLYKQYKDIPYEKRLTVLFDCLYDSKTEAIDAYTMFKFLKSRNIPVKYVLLNSNPLFAKLASEGNLTDILPVSNTYDFVLNYQDVIAQSKYIITSFGIPGNHHNGIPHNLSFTKYVFIEHGVTLLKRNSLKLYSPDNYNMILVPSKPTKKLYDHESSWKTENMIISGLPRWDTLHREKHIEKNIFLFFTWRHSFNENPNEAKIYIDKLEKLIDSIKSKTGQDKNIRIYIAQHHALNINIFDENKISKKISIVKGNEISKIIRKTDLFITDYSSVCFDLMYLDIPVIFYRFDYNIKYSEKSDIEAAISAKQFDNELYNCFYSEKETLEKVSYYINNDFVLEEKYRKINQNIFWNKNENCKKIWEQLEKGTHD